MHFIFKAIGGLFHLIWGVIWLILLIYTLLHVLNNGRLNTNTKLLWVIVIIVAPFLGSLLYLLWGKNQRL